MALTWRNKNVSYGMSVLLVAGSVFLFFSTTHEHLAGPHGCTVESFADCVNGGYKAQSF